MISNQSNFRLNHVCGHHPKEQRLVYACDVSWVFPSYLSMSNVDGLPCIGCLLLGAFGQMKQHSQTRKRNSPKLRMTYQKYIKSTFWFWPPSSTIHLDHHPPGAFEAQIPCPAFDRPRPPRSNSHAPSSSPPEMRRAKRKNQFLKKDLIKGSWWLKTLLHL